MVGSEYIWNPYHRMETDNLQEGLNLGAFPIENLAQGAFLLFWGHETFSVTSVPLGVMTLRRDHRHSTLCRTESIRFARTPNFFKRDGLQRIVNV
jgi:hypothetical protein